MTIQDAIDQLRTGHNYAMVFQPRANSFDVQNARYIIRNIATHGGMKLAYHELTMGSTGSGIYDEDMFVAIHEKTLARLLAQPRTGLRARLADPADFEWQAFDEADLPHNLIA